MSAIERARVHVLRARVCVCVCVCVCVYVCMCACACVCLQAVHVAGCEAAMCVGHVADVVANQSPTRHHACSRLVSTLSLSLPPLLLQGLLRRELHSDAEQRHHRIQLPAGGGEGPGKRAGARGAGLRTGVQSRPVRGAWWSGEVVEVCVSVW